MRNSFKTPEFHSCFTRRVLWRYFMEQKQEQLVLNNAFSFLAQLAMYITILSLYSITPKTFWYIEKCSKYLVGARNVIFWPV